MNILRWIGMVYLPLVLIAVVRFLYEEYKYPMCPECKDNFYSKRFKRKIICQIHGEI